MNVYLDWILTILYWIVWPIILVLYYIAIVPLYILQPILALLLLVATPFIHLGTFLGQCITWPFRFAGRFEVTFPAPIRKVRQSADWIHRRSTFTSELPRWSVWHLGCSYTSSSASYSRLYTYHPDLQAVQVLGSIEHQGRPRSRLLMSHPCHHDTTRIRLTMRNEAGEAKGACWRRLSTRRLIRISRPDDLSSTVIIHANIKAMPCPAPR